ncbi:aldehyde dehydrogenase family protein [Mycolicibacterium litorale]|uniref:aldehyde dehydrogenase family protein n=1 Tax=Mycolicibacterium litorale TaxID=758802 RepID=UPI003CEBCB9C
MLSQLNNWIDGKSVAPRAGNYVTGIDPATGRDTVDIAASDASDVDGAVQAAKRAADAWRRYPSADRLRVLNRIAHEIRRHADELATLEIQETGKPKKTALTEIENSAAYFEFYAGLVNVPVGEVLDVDPDQHVFTTREPFGVVGVITPWNVPLNQAARATAPALATGNVVVVKPAETTSQTTVFLAKLATQAGLPDGVFNVVLGAGSVGAAIVGHCDVRKVAFTGSVRTGKAIGMVAAERIIPLTLELGGKSANIVFADADLDFAASETVRAFTSNAGQVCSAGTRLLVEASIHDEFVTRVTERAAALREGVEVGPLITRTQYEQVQRYFEVARIEGARPTLGGSVSQNPALAGGFFVQPTIYPGVSKDMRIAREEIFGPVLVTLPFEHERDAIGLANDSDFGLVAGVFTRDIGRALRVASAIEAGQVFVNSWSTGAVQTPFGGHKNSGYGREKGLEAMLHYTQTKSTVVVY